jgi:hypothetical protein
MLCWYVFAKPDGLMSNTEDKTVDKMIRIHVYEIAEETKIRHLPRRDR